MRNLGKPLSDSERCQHVRQQAGGLTEGTGLEAAMVSGLPGVTLAKPSPTQIIPLPLGPSPPNPLPSSHQPGIPADLWLLRRPFLATVLSRLRHRRAGRAPIDQCCSLF